MFPAASLARIFHKLTMRIQEAHVSTCGSAMYPEDCLIRACEISFDTSSAEITLSQPISLCGFAAGEIGGVVLAGEGAGSTKDLSAGKAPWGAWGLTPRPGIGLTPRVLTTSLHRARTFREDARAAVQQQGIFTEGMENGRGKASAPPQS